MSWLKLYFLEICYKTCNLKFNFDYYIINCNYDNIIVKAYSKKIKRVLKKGSLKSINYKNVKNIIVVAFLVITIKNNNQIVII